MPDGATDVREPRQGGPGRAREADASGQVPLTAAERAEPARLRGERDAAPGAGDPEKSGSLQRGVDEVTRTPWYGPPVSVFLACRRPPPRRSRGRRRGARPAASFNVNASVVASPAAAAASAGRGRRGVVRAGRARVRRIRDEDLTASVEPRVRLVQEALKALDARPVAGCGGVAPRGHDREGSRAGRGALADWTAVTARRVRQRGGGLRADDGRDRAARAAGKLLQRVQSRPRAPVPAMALTMTANASTPTLSRAPHAPHPHVGAALPCRASGMVIGNARPKGGRPNR